MTGFNCYLPVQTDRVLRCPRCPEHQAWAGCSDTRSLCGSTRHPCRSLAPEVVKQNADFFLFWLKLQRKCTLCSKDTIHLKRTDLTAVLNRVVCGAAAHLHPKEESLRAGFELQHINTAGGALAHPFELAVIRENDQILSGQTVRVI